LLENVQRDFAHVQAAASPRWMAARCIARLNRCRGWAKAMRAFLACGLLAAAFALAGCTAPSDDHSDDHPTASTSASQTATGTPAPTASSYSIDVFGFPTMPLAPSATFNFTDHITGDAQRTSDHIGAHFGPNSTTTPSTTAYPSICQHTHGDMPGDFMVVCTAPATPGTYYLRGHARITLGANSTVSWWGDELTFTVA
jgi:hypothetical protein